MRFKDKFNLFANITTELVEEYVENNKTEEDFVNEVLNDLSSHLDLYSIVLKEENVQEKIKIIFEYDYENERQLRKLTIVLLGTLKMQYQVVKDFRQKEEKATVLSLVVNNNKKED